MKLYLTEKQIRILLELVVLKKNTEVAKLEQCSPYTVSSQKTSALNLMYIIADQYHFLIRPAQLISKLARGDDQGYSRDLQCWIERGYSNPATRRYWDQIPRSGALPTPEELFAFLIEQYRNLIITKMTRQNRKRCFQISFPEYAFGGKSLFELCCEYSAGFQVRMYSKTNELISQEPQSSYEEASERLKTCRNFGRVYRAVLRAYNPFFDSWVILHCTNIEPIPAYQSAVSWKLVSYGIDDSVIKEEIREEPWTLSEEKERCEEENACYLCVLSQKEEGGDFLLNELYCSERYCYREMREALKEYLAQRWEQVTDSHRFYCDWLNL